MTTKMLTPKKRVVTALVGTVAALSLAALTGCTANSSPNANGEISGTLQMIVSSAPGSNAGFKALNAAFTKKYPKVKIVFTALGDSYAQAISSRLTAGSVDLLVAKPVTVPSYAKGSDSDDSLLAKSGAFVDLTSEPFMKNFTPTVLDSTKFEGKQYTVPTGISYETGVYYNKAIFAKYGLSVPTTWTDFLKVSSTLQSNGVTPLGIGGKDSWPAGLPMLAAVAGQYPTASDKEAAAKAIWEQSAKLTDAPAQSILDKTSQIYGLAQKNFAGQAYADMPGSFASGDFAMTPDGTWDETTIASAVGSKFDFGYFPLPTSANPEDNKSLDGKVELRLAAASASHNKAAAVAYLKFFSQPKNYKKFVALAGFAPSEPNIPLSEFLNSISTYTGTFEPAWDQVWTASTKAGSAALFPFNYTAMSPLGSGSPTSAAKSAQQAWSAGF